MARGPFAAVSHPQNLVPEASRPHFKHLCTPSSSFAPLQAPLHPLEHQEDLLKDLYRATELATMPIETREYYDQNMRTELDIIAQKDYAVKQGRAEGEAKGRAEGRAEGKAEGKAEVAKAMLKDGMALEKVLAYTGLSRKEVEALTV